MGKLFKINTAAKDYRESNSKGYRWEYNGKVDDWGKAIDQYNNGEKYRYSHTVGIRVTDTKTGKVVYEQLEA